MQYFKNKRDLIQYFIIGHSLKKKKESRSELIYYYFIINLTYE